MCKRVLTVTLNPAIDHTVEVPDFSLDTVNRASSSRRDPGGKGINVATALAQGGLDTVVTGFLGIENKQIFTSHFLSVGLEDQFILVNGPTREGFKLVDPVNRITTDINLKGFQLGKEKVNQFLDHFSSLVQGVDYILLSGSLPEGVMPDIYGTLAKLAQKSGAFVAVDTSGEALKGAIESGSVNLIKPNIDELSEIDSEIARSSHPLECAHEKMGSLLEQVGMIALSMGERGSRLYTPKGWYETSAPVVSVKSTVGAGDAFLAGFIKGFSEDHDPVSALKTAASWAASTLTIYGPGLSLENPPELFFENIRIHFHKRVLL